MAEPARQCTMSQDRHRRGEQYHERAESERCKEQRGQDRQGLRDFGRDVANRPCGREPEGEEHRQPSRREAALGLFEERGYDATTCEDIAAAADVSVRTFFRYFDTKVDVVLAGRSDDQGPQAVIAEVLDRPDSERPVEVLRHALRHPVGVLESQRDLVVRQFRVMLATPSLDTLRREQFHRFEDPLAAAIATRLGRQPDDLDARLLAAATAAALRISIERWVTSGARPGALGPLGDEAFDRLEHGLGASKRATASDP